MAFDQNTRNRLQKFVNDARNLLTEEFTRQLQATYGLDPSSGSVAAVDSLTHLDNRQRQAANILRDTLAHYLATTHGKGEKDRIKQALSRIVREQAFTVLNRLAAVRMAEARGFLLETIAKGYNAKGFQLYKQLAGGALGETGEAYRNYLYSVFDEFSLDLAVLFDRHSAQGRLFPKESVLLELLDLINHHEIELLWAEDETIGWIYQYFNSQEERKKMRAESQAPRNSRELAVRNQFFTPRYVVEFLTDNTLGRIWYEMTQGNTGLVESCRYLVRRPHEVFLKPGEQVPEQEENAGKAETLSQEELLKQPVYISHRAIKDPRCIRMLDPACGSMHFGLYAFDLYERIYEEAWQFEAELGEETFVREGDLKPLHKIYDSFEDYRTEIPRLIIEHNIHGVDIDPRAVQIAGLSLWQRAQRAWQQQNIKPQQRPVVRKSNIVCAEPMPGERALLQEFSGSLNPPVLGQLLEAIFDKMELAGEAGTLLKIEEEIQASIHEAKDQWQTLSDSNFIGNLFQAELDQATPRKKLGFDLSGVDDESFWDSAEQLILDALNDYAGATESNADQKRLFAEDAAKGFAFIELCRKRFDVVLMNPPFGDAAKAAKNYLSSNYSSASSDIGMMFVSSLGKRLSVGGLLGAITNRTCLSTSQLGQWRSEALLGKSKLTLVADLGYGVLDDAMVEAAAYVVEKADDIKTLAAFRLLYERKKEEALLESIDYWSSMLPDDRSLIGLLETYKNLPLSVIAYWAPPSMLQRINSGTLIKEKGFGANDGGHTGDDYRFLRTVWEIPSELIGRNKDYVYFAKGGEYSPFWDDIHLLEYWKENGREIRQLSGARIYHEDKHFNPGLTFPLRTTSDFSPRILPEDTMFSTGGHGIHFAKLDDALIFLAFSYTRALKVFIEILFGGGDAAARNFTAGTISLLPFPDIPSDRMEVFKSKTLEIVNHFFKLSLSDETNRYFTGLPYLDPHKNVVDGIKDFQLLRLSLLRKIAEISNYFEDASIDAFSLIDEEVEPVLRTIYGVHPCSYPRSDNLDDLSDFIDMGISELMDRAGAGAGSTNRSITKKSYFIDRQIDLICHATSVHPESIISWLESHNEPSFKQMHEYCFSILSYFVGISFCRWSNSIEYPVDILGLSDPFSSIPVEQPCIANETRRLRTNGVLDQDSLVDSIRSEVCQIWGSSGKHDFVFDELTQNIEAKSIKDYLSNANYFFERHLKQYSKSRRQAPIYWPLQTISGSYTLWVYYHSLSQQTLYTCINDFVEPKLKTIEEDLNGLRSISSRSNQEEKDLSRLADLELELRNFRDELLRIAKFWKPNLNDGVQVTAAPLWKLFQHKAWQKKLKETWESLEKGDYDWAHLACSIWPERVLRKCHQDRSLAIAHDVEEHFWHEVEVPVLRRGRETGETKLEWQPKKLMDTELNVLIQAKIKEINA